MVSTGPGTDSCCRWKAQSSTWGSLHFPGARQRNRNLPGFVSVSSVAHHVPAWKRVHTREAAGVTLAPWCRALTSARPAVCTSASSVPSGRAPRCGRCRHQGSRVTRALFSGAPRGMSAAPRTFSVALDQFGLIFSDFVLQ